MRAPPSPADACSSSTVSAATSRIANGRRSLRRRVAAST
jgi:hypothetical protein